MEQPSEVKKTEQVGAIMFLVLLLIIALIYLVIKPQLANLKENNIQVAAKKAEFNDKEKQINNLKTLQNTLSSSSGEVKKLSTALPKKEKISELIVQLDAIAKGQGLAVNSITPVSHSEFEGEEINKSESSKPIVGRYNFVVSMTGSYSGLLGFMQTIEYNLRPLNIEKADFAAGSGSNPNISANLTMETYYQL